METCLPIARPPTTIKDVAGHPSVTRTGAELKAVEELDELVVEELEVVLLLPGVTPRPEVPIRPEVIIPMRLKGPRT